MRNTAPTAIRRPASALAEFTTTHPQPKMGGLYADSIYSRFTGWCIQLSGLCDPQAMCRALGIRARIAEVRLNLGVAIDKRRKLKTSTPTAARMWGSYIPDRSPKTCSGQCRTAPELRTGLARDGKVIV